MPTMPRLTLYLRQRPEEQENAPAAAADETGGIPPPSFRDTSAIGTNPQSGDRLRKN